MKASIDIGTNTVLLLIAEIEDERLKEVRQEQRIPRLGKGVDNSKVLHQESIGRVLETLKEYKSIIDSEYPLVDRCV